MPNIELLDNTQKIGWAGGEYFERVDTDRITLNARLTVSQGVTLTDGYLVVTNIPTSDPAVAGQIWNDDGLLKVSAG